MRSIKSGAERLGLTSFFSIHVDDLDFMVAAPKRAEAVNGFVQVRAIAVHEFEHELRLRFRGRRARCWQTMGLSSLGR